MSAEQAFAANARAEIEHAMERARQERDGK
jgi:hypothetical protein